MKRADEMTAWEYLVEELYEAAWSARRKGFDGELASLKAVLPCLKSFEHLTDLLNVLADTGNRPRSKALLTEIAGLYRRSRNLRPASGLILLLANWDELEKNYGTGDRFAQGCYDLLVGLLEPQIPQINAD